MATAYVGLGANLGNPRKQIILAVRQLQKIPGAKVIALSPFYNSAPQGCPGRQPDYCNAAAALRTTLSPRQLHRKLQQAERAVRIACGGKPRRSGAPRHIDIDYLFHSCAVLRGKQLILPHPRLLQRRFVLRPLADITGGDFRTLRWQQKCTDALHKLNPPPIILALESGGESFSAALTMPNGDIVMHSTNGGHSENALPQISDLLRACKITLAQCDAVAFAAGPGKFSGLRLSCALVKSFAYAHNIPIVQVPTLAALAESNYPAEQKQKQKTKAVIPAQRGHFYMADCFVDNGIWHSGDIAVIRTDNNPAPMPTMQHPNAAATARIALQMFAKGETISPLLCAPVYIRQKIALTIKERAKAGLINRRQN